MRPCAAERSECAAPGCGGSWCGVCLHHAEASVVSAPTQLVPRMQRSVLYGALLIRDP
jgi:hypothetical protein